MLAAVMSKAIQIGAGRLLASEAVAIRSVFFSEDWKPEETKAWLADRKLDASKPRTRDGWNGFEIKAASEFDASSLRTIDNMDEIEIVSRFEELFELSDIEVFRAGTWNGDKYTTKDLDAIVEAFGKMGFRPPIKLGHAEQSGAPAYGWVKNIRRVGEKLVADFMDLPEKIFKAIKDHRYDAVSCEIFFDLKRGESVFKRALKAVALLGAEVPAVSGLKPLRESFFETSAKAQSYSLTQKELEQGQMTDKKDDPKTVAELTAELAKLQDQLKTLSTKQGDDPEQVKQLKADLEAKDRRLAAIESDRAKERIESAVGKCKVPAYSQFLTHLYDLAAAADGATEAKKYSIGSGDKAKEVSAFSVVDSLVEKINTDAEHLFRMHSVAGTSPPDLENDDVQIEVDLKVRAHMAEKKVEKYADALQAVLNSDPDLKKRYHEATAPDA